MPLTLHQQLANLKQELLSRADPAPSKLADICEALLALIEQNRADLTEAFEAQVKADQRLNALEKRVPGYEARG